jgi:hypothetical protein
MNDEEYEAAMESLYGWLIKNNPMWVEMEKKIYPTLKSLGKHEKSDFSFKKGDIINIRVEPGYNNKQNENPERMNEIS